MKDTLLEDPTNISFPDERRYTNQIFKHISIPLKIEIDLERQTKRWRVASH